MFFSFSFFCFLFYLVTFFVIPVFKEKIKVKITPAIPIGAPATLTEEIIQKLLLAAERTIKFLSMQSNAGHFFTA